MLSTRLASAFILTALAVPAFAQDVSYEIVNNSGLALMEFYTSVADEGSFGDDLLAAQVLASGEATTVTIPDGGANCDRDLRILFEDGSEMYDRVNVCDTASYTLSPS